MWLSEDEVKRVRALGSAELKALVYEHTTAVYGERTEREVRAVVDLVIPHLLSVLERPGAFEPIQGSAKRDSAGERVLLRIPAGRYEELKPLLRRWLKTGDRKIVQRLASHITSFGSDDLLSESRLVLEHADPMLSMSARGGALDALKSGRAEEGFRRLVWDHCVELLLGDNPPAAYDPIRLLELIDLPGTCRILQQPEILRPDYKLLGAAVNRLRRSNELPSGEVLVDLAERVDQRSPDGGRAMNQIVPALLQLRHPWAAAHAETILAHPAKHSDEVVEQAWQVRFACAGLKSRVEQAEEQMESPVGDVEALEPDQRAIYFLSHLNPDEEGLLEWYEKGVSPWLEELPCVLERLGLPEHAALVAEANAIVRTSGVQGDRDAPADPFKLYPDSVRRELCDLDGRWMGLPHWRILALEAEWKQRLPAPLNELSPTAGS